MKNLIYKLLIFVLGVFLFTSCEKNDIPTIDVQNARAIAGFNGLESQKIVFDPSANTESTFSVGVSTLSDMERRVQIRVADESTLDPSFYTISTLTPVIAAGDFTTDITITTIGGVGVPPGSAVLVLELVSVEDSEVLTTSTKTVSVGLDVKCPSVDPSLIAGTYEVTASTFANFFEETVFSREIVAGPGADQFTVVGGAYLNEGAEDLIFTIDPESGSVKAIDETKIASIASFGRNNYKFLPGGRVLTCAGIVELKFDFGGNIQGNPSTFNLIKQ